MRKLLVTITVIALGGTAAHSQELPRLLSDAPCNWFVKIAPDVWATHHIIRADTWGIVNGQLAFGPGTYKVDDGTDAYELIERKCGHGATPRSAYRIAMPLPFGLFPWYR
jgi:hypothetical protein